MPHTYASAKKDAGTVNARTRDTASAHKASLQSAQRAIVTNEPLNVGDVQALQRSAGNRAVGALIQMKRQSVIQRNPHDDSKSDEESGDESPSGSDSESELETESESETSSDTTEEERVAVVQSQAQFPIGAVILAPVNQMPPPVPVQDAQQPVPAPVIPGQQAPQNIPPPVIQGGPAHVPVLPPPPTAHTPSVLMSADAFKLATSQRKGRGATLKELKRMLNAYHTGVGRPINSQNVQTAIDMVMDIQELASVWLLKHAGDTAQQTRIQTMQVIAEQAMKEVAILRQLKGQLAGGG
ncbi:MAG TPA: hypothetical protein VGK87_04895, partial [Anaerolineae bacterium]